MTNERKLELTLCGMLPYGLWVYDSLNQIVKVIGVKNQTYFIENGNNYAYADIRDCKPRLYSLDKLTEPIIEGGLIPIVWLAKYVDNGHNQRDSKVKKIGNIVRVYTDNVDDVADVCFYFHNKELLSVKLLSDNICFSTTQIIIEKLKEWHFNIYDLPSDMYIEKSTVNI